MTLFTVSNLILILLFYYISIPYGNTLEMELSGIALTRSTAQNYCPLAVLSSDVLKQEAIQKCQENTVWFINFVSFQRRQIY